MTGVRHILLALLSLIGLLSLSAWSGDASACQVRSTGAVAATAMPMHRQHHHPAPARGRDAPAQSGMRLDCAGCVGVLPVFPSMESQDLMPFAPVADGIQPLTGIHPAVDPPPPRRGED